MACDDEALNEEKREIRKYRTIKKCLMYSLNIGYVIALIACLICNLVIDHKLSWFLIVLVGITISYAITTLPLYLKKDKYRLFKVSIILTALIYLLLCIINLVYNEFSLLDSYKICTFILGLYWLDILVVIFTKINKYYKISFSLILLAICTIFTNPLCNKILDISNESSNIPNIISGIIMIISALVILGLGYKKND